MKPAAPSLVHSKRGSALLMIIVFAAVLSVMIAGLMRHSLTERRLNKRHELRLEAKNAAEAVVEYGFSQLSYKFKHRTSLNAEALRPGSGDELSTPPDSLLGPQIVTTKLQLVGGTIPPFPNSLTYIDRKDENNRFDPLKGKYVRSREISLFGRAAISDPAGGPNITAYVSQTLQVRDAPLFAHAIFYNLDLEFHPGPNMDVYGPVHTNGTLYVQAVNKLTFHDQVTTSSDMLKGLGYKEEAQSGDVYWLDRDDNKLSYRIKGKFYDSSTKGPDGEEFRSFASNRWHGNLLTRDHGITDYLPVAFQEYEPDDPTTSAYDPKNSGRAIIEPPLPKDHADFNEEIERQKISTKAGLTLKWDTDQTTLLAYRKARNASEDPDGDGYVQLDISNLSGSGADKLWEHRPNVMHDWRRVPNQADHAIDLTLMELNVGKLKQLIENPDTDNPTGHIGRFDPATDWNGIIYLECSGLSSNPKDNPTGIRLWGGETDVVGQGLPSRGVEPGMTFATNNVLYVKGNFNADGHLDQEGSFQHSAVVPEAGEVPVALMADTVTFLSNDWDDAASATSDKVKKPKASSTEVAVAVVSGIVPSNAQGNATSSGGAHNYPRFLEDWNGRDFFLRGSMVCLYESEVDRSLYKTNHYSPPNRKWGYNDLFREGTYPPGTPLLRTFRRVDFRDLSASEYKAAVEALPWGLTVTD